MIPFDGCYLRHDPACAFLETGNDGSQSPVFSCYAVIRALDDPSSLPFASIAAHFISKFLVLALVLLCGRNMDLLV